jgi:hypothetical protein
MGKIIFLAPCLLQPLGSFNHMVACRNSLKPILNNTSPQAYIELEFNVFGVPRKLLKYVVHSSKRRN